MSNFTSPMGEKTKNLLMVPLSAVLSVHANSAVPAGILPLTLSVNTDVDVAPY